MSCTFRPDHSWNDHGVCLICGRLKRPDLARARAASEAVTIQALRDENQALTAEVARLRQEFVQECDALGILYAAEVARLRAMLPDPATHTHDGTRRDHTIPVRLGYRDVGI